MSLKITNIQRFSLQDGPGIRTTVFLKGCSIRCPWCCNPENIKTLPEFYFKKNDCINCEECIKVCPINILESPEKIREINETQLSDCLQCRACIDICPTNAVGIYGENISTADLFEMLVKDKEYYSINNGGVTFSGGEPLIQAEELFKIIKLLRDDNINVTLETSLFAPPSYMKIIEDMVDLFIIDIKILDKKSCETFLQGNLDDFKTNFKVIVQKKIPYILRFPITKPFTFNEENINSLINFIQENKIKVIEIFQIHDFGANKYSSLGLKSNKPESIPPNEIDDLVDKLENIDVQVKLLNL